MKRKIEIVIDEFVLDGFNPADRYAISEALSAELERLANRPGTNLNFGSRDFLNAGMISLPPNARPGAVGAQVGRAVFTGLTSGAKKESKDPGHPFAPASLTPLHSSGQPLDPQLRSLMETRFEHDFSQVRIHTDTQAAESAHEMQARAYALKNEIVFGAGQYQPQTPEGQFLLAHELTHVVQQQSATGPAQLGSKDSPGEAEANLVARAVVANQKIPKNIARTEAFVARQPADAPVANTAQAEREREVEAIKVGEANYVLYQNEVRTGGSSSWLANNPGNMDLTENTVKWGSYEGKFLQWGKHRFAIFPNEQTGLSAVQAFLRMFQGKRDITLMMNLFAPAGDVDNNPTQYSESVAKALGVPVTTLVKDLSVAQLGIFAKEIQRVEGWKVGATYQRGDPALPKEVRDR